MTTGMAKQTAGQKTTIKPAARVGNVIQAAKNLRLKENRQKWAKKFGGHALHYQHITKLLVHFVQAE